jgi:azurin/lysophospholipase L1-like esterase
MKTCIKLILILLSIIAPGFGQGFDFKNGDRIAIVGNSLADRMQHDGWVETLLQSQLGGKEVSIRNLGFAGDRVNNRPRNRGFMSADAYLKHVKADVIFAFFGYNESFEGPNGLGKFKDELGKMLDTYQAARFNGESDARLVLFTPIAHENLQDKNLPNGKINNHRITLYADAIKEVAEAKKVPCVDLFNATMAAYARSKSPLTLNGVHLSAEGNKVLAQIITEALTGKTISRPGDHEKLRQAVIDKDLHWYNRYRATDGNDVWGGRSGLAFVGGQKNFEVMQRELEMFDVMTANRDKRIWALAKGKDSKVDDSNVPKPIKVISNVGGGSKSSNASKEGSIEYLDSEVTVSKMALQEGFEVNVFADEKMFPELVNPVQSAVDPRGRLWVAAWKTYPKWEPGKEMDDRLLILPDENRDGVADKAITFAKVHNPTGIEFWNNGVIVVSAPDILYLKDTDGDDVADVRVHMLQGIDSADTHHTANNLVYGPGGNIYYQRGVFHVSNVETPWVGPQQNGESGMYRWNPRTHEFSFHAKNSPNPHGISFDYWGYHYATDGTGGRAYQVVPDKTGFKMRSLLKKTVRPVPANGIISSEQFPPESQGNFLICNSIGYLGMKQYKLDRNPENGEVNGTQVDDLIVCKDRNFRPTDVEFGSDGAMYFCDWQNVIIGHMQHNIRDPNRDHKHGRVYRMIAKGRPLQKDVPVFGQSIDVLLNNLKHPIDGIRHRTHIELSGRDTAKVIAATRKWVKQFDTKKAEDAHHILEALWVHQQHNVIDQDLLTTVLTSPEPHARHAATVVQHHWSGLARTAKSTKADHAEAIAKPEPRRSGGVFEITILTVMEKMQYDTKSFDVKAGEKVKLTFTNPDYLPHNIVIVQPGSADEIALAGISLGAKGFETGFVPDSDKIIAATPLIDHGKSKVLNFTAPTTPGDYQFVCTFPGHAPLMRGVMKVR